MKTRIDFRHSLRIERMSVAKEIIVFKVYECPECYCCIWYPSQAHNCPEPDNVEEDEGFGDITPEILSDTNIEDLKRVSEKAYDIVRENGHVSLRKLMIKLTKIN